MKPILHAQLGQPPDNLRILRDEASPPYDGTSRRKHVTVIDDDTLDAVARLGGYALAVYVRLERRANKESMCWPSYQTLADDIGVTRRHVIDVVKALVGAGFVETRKRSGPHGGPASNEFYLPHHIVPENPSDSRGEPSERPSEPDSPASERPSEQPRARTRHGDEVVAEVVDTPLPPKGRVREEYPADFERFWAQYPSGHGNKKKSGAEWKRIKPDADTMDAIMAGLARWNACDRWQRGFVKSAEVWLRDRWWEDPTPDSKPAPNGRSPSSNQADQLSILDDYAYGRRS